MKMLPTILILLTLIGCTPAIPSTTTKANGYLTTTQGTADLTVIFQPPDHFRIVANHPLASGRILDIGGNGDIIWYQTNDSTIVMKGKISLETASPFTPKPKTFTPPPDLKP
jgi:hypothetical protein